MANVTGNNAEVGDLAKTGGAEIISGKCDATGVTKGDVVSFDSNGLIQKASSGDEIGQGFGVALETGSANETDVRVAIGNSYVYVTADGAIKPNFLVKVATSTTGQVDSHGNTADTTTTITAVDVNSVKDYFGLTVGRYIGHQLQEDLPTDAADGDIIAVRLGL